MQVIYAVECVENGFIYVGYSANHLLRWRTHRRLLRRKIHASAKMIEDWHKYGPDAFAMRVLEILPPSIEIRDARQVELRWQGHFARLGLLYNEPKCSVCGRPYEFAASETGEAGKPDGEIMHDRKAAGVSGQAAPTEAPATKVQRHDG
jgi:GIY-YIG catalytic domain